METVGILFLCVLLLFVLFCVRSTSVYEYQAGLRYRNGKFVRILAPGRHWFLQPWEKIEKTDVRDVALTIPGQEVLTADNVSLKVSLSVRYRIIDANVAVNRLANFRDALYQAVQLASRTIIGSLNVEDLLRQRESIGKRLLETCAPEAKAMGVQLILADLRDIMFPGELKNIFAQIVQARNEGLAALERARGESASLRNLANAARLMDDNPNLRALRLYQVLEKTTGNTVVFGLPDEVPLLKRKTDRKTGEPGAGD